jgi:hypothetical protein
MWLTFIGLWMLGSAGAIVVAVLFGDLMRVVLVVVALLLPPALLGIAVLTVAVWSRLHRGKPRSPQDT